MNLKAPSVIRRLHIALFGFAVFCFAHIVTGCSSSQAAHFEKAKKPAPANHSNILFLPSETQQAINLQTDLVCQHVLDASVKTTGEVQANTNKLAHINAPVSGRVIDVKLIAGDHVTQGQPLVTIRSSDVEGLEAELLQNQAQIRSDLKRDLLQLDSDIKQATAQLALAQSSYNRVSSLVDEKIASKAELERALTELEKNKICLETFQSKRSATIELSKERERLVTEPLKQKLRLIGVSPAQLHKLISTREIDPLLVVVSPSSGVITDRKINSGELVENDRLLFTIGDFHDVWVKADVYEKDISKIKIGDPIELSLESVEGLKFHGKINYIADSVNPETRTLSVRADVPNIDNKLKPKMFARMHILTGKDKLLCIPKQAVQDAGSQKVVYVAKGSGLFEERQVALGAAAGDHVQILSGLKVGERVVTDGSFQLRSVFFKDSE